MAFVASCENLGVRPDAVFGSRWIIWQGNILTEPTTVVLLQCVVRKKGKEDVNYQAMDKSI